MLIKKFSGNSMSIVIYSFFNYNKNNILNTIKIKTKLNIYIDLEFVCVCFIFLTLNYNFYVKPLLKSLYFGIRAWKGM